MSFASETGYIPETVANIIESMRLKVNEQFGTTYSTDNFVGTNFYKFCYAFAQRVQEQEIKTSEIFLQTQQYFKLTNEKVLRPNTTHPGIQDYFKSKGWLASTKAPIDADAGKLYICVNIDSARSDYAARKLELANLVKDCCVGGVISQGTEATDITLDNGQQFTFKYNLPTKIPVLLKLTLTTSANNLYVIDDVDTIRTRLYNNINAIYTLGKNFEPQRYFTAKDAPWASIIKLEWSSNAGSSWNTTVYAAAYNEIFTFALADVSLVQL